MYVLRYEIELNVNESNLGLLPIARAFTLSAVTVAVTPRLGALMPFMLFIESVFVVPPSARVFTLSTVRVESYFALTPRVARAFTLSTVRVESSLSFTALFDRA